MRGLLRGGVVVALIVIAGSASAQRNDDQARAEIQKLRLGLAGPVTPDVAGSAIAEYDRIAGTHAGTAVAPEALYYAAEAAHLGGRDEEAIHRYHEVAAQYPASPFTPRALLAAGTAHLRNGDPTRAMTVLQGIRTGYEASPEAARALSALTVLYRLYVRAPLQPAFTYSTTIADAGGRFRDVRDLGVAVGSGHLFVATPASVLELDAAGALVRTVNAPDAKSLFFDAAGQVVTVHERGTLRAEGRPPLVLSAARSDGRLQPIEIDAAVTTSAGDMVVANRAQKTLVRFSADGRPRGDVARAISARRLAASPGDDLAALDTDAKTIVILDGAGQVRARLTERGTGYQFRDPVDVAFDSLGHLYVLDRGRVLVFAPGEAGLVTTFSVPDRTPGAFGSAEAIALDSAGRLYLFDDRTKAIQVFR